VLVATCWLAYTQGKVRRIRTSPFHKGSGDSAPAAAKPAAAKKAKKAADSSEEEVRVFEHLQKHRRRRSSYSQRNIDAEVACAPAKAACVSCSA